MWEKEWEERRIPKEQWPAVGFQSIALEFIVIGLNSGGGRG